jgi:catechol 2,3-dioxygenase-like lactoylglutathione lyase family enzyme
VHQTAWVTFTKLVVADLDRSAEFYKEVCGLTELTRVHSEISGDAIDEIIFRRAEQGGMQFVLLKYLQKPDPVNGEVIVGVTTDDVAGFVDRARAAGGEIVREPQIFNGGDYDVKVAFVRDLEGHLLEVIEHGGPR